MTEELLKAAKERVPDLSAVEGRMLRAVRARAFCGSDEDSNPSNEPQCGAQWTNPKWRTEEPCQDGEMNTPLYSADEANEERIGRAMTKYLLRLLGFAKLAMLTLVALFILSISTLAQG